MNVFSPRTGWNASNGTSNLNWLVSEADMKWLETVRPEHLEMYFTHANSGNDIDYKGYHDDEWYWSGAYGKRVFGIGWRWGRTRLRGKNISREDAASFLSWLRHMLEGPAPAAAENNETISRENV